MVTVDCSKINFEIKIQECQPDMRTRIKKNTYTEFNPNPENKDYRKKHLGVKKINYKK